MSRLTVKTIEYALWFSGALALSYCGYVALDGYLAQKRGSEALDRTLSNKIGPPVAGQARAVNPAPPYGGLVGRLEIPRLKLSLIVFEGTDEPVLQKGVGHLMGSSLPGDSGNVVLAAHRDTFFRSLKDIQPGDDVRVTTPNGTKQYIVDSTDVIRPDQTDVLNATASPTLTLITCYPFQFVGHAPKRFIVRARPVDTPQPPRTEVAAASLPAKPTAPVAVSTTASEKPKSRFQLVELPRPESMEPTESGDTEDVAKAKDPDEMDTAAKKRRIWNPVRLLGKLARFGRGPKTEPTASEMH